MTSRFRTTPLLLAALLALGLVAGAGCNLDPHRAERERRAALELVAQAQGLEGNREWEAARRRYVQAWEVSPRPVALLGAARCLKELGRFEEAKRVLDDLLAISPNVREASVLREQVIALGEGRALERDAALGKGDEPPASSSASATPPAGAAAGAAAGRRSEESIGSSGVEELPADEAADPALARRSSLASRRQRAGVTSEDELPSAVREQKAREAVREYDQEKERQTVAELRDQLALKPEKKELPDTAAIEEAFFSPGYPKPETHIPANGVMYSSEFYVERARSLVAQGKLAEARVALDEAIVRNPRNPEAYVEMGYVYERLGQPERAPELYARALELSPRLPRAHYRLGNAHLVGSWGKKGHPGFAAAVNAYDAALAIDPKYLYALHNKGVALMEMDLVESARTVFLKCAEIDPGYAPTYRNLGIIAERHAGDTVRALSYYREYLELGGRDEENVRSWIREIELELSGR